eukprot:TRINITY_DN20368_c0_g1_i1.p1 TRINITY_DN20368_c0_g1~~TRINITY_DN20368_c0_g1_i1.p1  ORF type:complete len:175 (-),score=33.33 TRINITY_DN20368_c0_g1_i1:413-937(-)
MEGVSRKWTFEFQEATFSTTKEVPDPLGYGKLPGELEDRGDGRQKKEVMEADFKNQKAMEFGQSPFKQVLMMGFMMYMAGTQINLFTIGIVVSGVWQPINALRNLDKSFEPFKDPRNSLLLPKLMFVLLQLAALGLCVWKLNALGLLPTHSSDWVSSLSPPSVIEFAGGGVPFD